MKQLLLLILCLLAIFKSFSQNDTITKNPYVILTEKQARSVVKDIIHMDALEEINRELEKRIVIFLKREDIFHKVITTKDTIISNKDKIIAIKDKMLNAKKFIGFHGYTGISTFNFDFNNPIFYGRAQLEFKKINIGAIINFQPVISVETFNSTNYSFYIEYKIF